ncbi:MAG: CinA family protein [Prevotellaceae bacterium]|nr:CinA family protein [Prevotellaceae bacterium]
MGTVWIAVATPQKVASQMLQLGNNRERTTLRAAVHALNLLRLQLVES